MNKSCHFMLLLRFSSYSIVFRVQRMSETNKTTSAIRRVLVKKKLNVPVVQCIVKQWRKGFFQKSWETIEHLSPTHHITMLSDGPISARLMSVKISWFTCQNGDKKSLILTYFWIYFEDQMTICTFLMIPACIWTIFGECINDNHRENQC